MPAHDIIHNQIFIIDYRHADVTIQNYDVRYNRYMVCKMHTIYTYYTHVMPILYLQKKIFTSIINR